MHHLINKKYSLTARKLLKASKERQPTGTEWRTSTLFKSIKILHMFIIVLSSWKQKKCPPKGKIARSLIHHTGFFSTQQIQIFALFLCVSFLLALVYITLPATQNLHTHTRYFISSGNRSLPLCICLFSCDQVPITFLCDHQLPTPLVLLYELR